MTVQFPGTTSNDNTLGIKNGMLGTVENIHSDKITAKLDNGARVTVNPHIYKQIDHGYAVTIHKSQGATVDQAYVLASRTLDSPLTYVAMTRHRDSMRLFINEKDKPGWVPSKHLRKRQRHIKRGPAI